MIFPFHSFHCFAAAMTAGPKSMSAEWRLQGLSLQEVAWKQQATEQVAMNKNDSKMAEWSNLDNVPRDEKSSLMLSFCYRFYLLNICLP